MQIEAGSKISMATEGDTYPTRSVFLDKHASGAPGFKVESASPFGIPTLFHVLQALSSKDLRGLIELLTWFSGMVEY